MLLQVMLLSVYLWPLWPSLPEMQNKFQLNFVTIRRNLSKVSALPTEVEKYLNWSQEKFKTQIFDLAN